MTFRDDLDKSVKDLINTPFNIRTARVVPTTDSVGPNDYVSLFDTVYLYTDMADSSSLAHRFDVESGARVLRVFLNVVCRVIRDRGGEIRSFDGDRVMGIFLGEDAVNKAADAALRITWAVSVLAHDALLDLDSYRKEYYENDWKLRHRTGIDIGFARVVRGGVRSHSDLVSIGQPPNIAAKLSDYKGGGTTIITDTVYDKLSYSNSYSDSDDVSRSMWVHVGWTQIGSQYEDLYTSTWRRSYQ